MLGLFAYLEELNSMFPVADGHHHVKDIVPGFQFQVFPVGLRGKGFVEFFTVRISTVNAIYVNLETDGAIRK
jgi:hypothetical protein